MPLHAHMASKKGEQRYTTQTTKFKPCPNWKHLQTTLSLWFKCCNYLLTGLKHCWTRGPWWPWIAHLSQFPPQKMNYAFSITIVPTYDPGGWGQFWPQGYHINKIDKGPNIIVQGQMIKVLLVLFSEKKNFKVFLLCSYVSNLWPPPPPPPPRAGPNLTHGASYEQPW